MNTNRNTKRRLPVRFGAPRRFEVPKSRPGLRTAAEARLDALKRALLQEYLFEREEPGVARSVQGAANDAAALAWATPFPLLVLPLLFEEKAAEARQRAKHQEEVLRRSEILLGDAA